MQYSIAYHETDFSPPGVNFGTRAASKTQPCTRARREKAHDCQADGVNRPILLCGLAKLGGSCRSFSWRLWASALFSVEVGTVLILRAVASTLSPHMCTIGAAISDLFDPCNSVPVRPAANLLLPTLYTQSWPATWKQVATSTPNKTLEDNCYVPTDSKDMCVVYQ